MPPPPARITPTASPPPDASPRTTQPVTLGGYRWSAVDASQFGGVALAATTSTSDHRLLAVGDWGSADAPDGMPRHPTTWASADGATWSRLQDSPAFVSRRANWEEIVLAIEAAGNGFVAVGVEQEEDASSADAAAWFSPDGTTWTRATVKDGTGRTMDQVVVTDNGFVALGEAGYDFHGGFGAGSAIWTSTDGRTWARLPDKEAPPRGTRLRSVVVGTGGFLASASFEVSQGAEGNPRQPVTDGVWRSTDAIHWGPIRGTPLGIAEIAKVADGYVAVGSTNTDAGITTPLAWRSTDGRTWTSIVLAPPSGLPPGSPSMGSDW